MPKYTLLLNTRVRSTLILQVMLAGHAVAQCIPFGEECTFTMVYFFFLHSSLHFAFLAAENSLLENIVYSDFFPHVIQKQVNSFDTRILSFPLNIVVNLLPTDKITSSTFVST